MEIKIKPWNGSERLYFYRQSQQLAGQTGQIGKLRADFDRDGNGFFSSWEDIRNHLKTEEFKQTFDDVNNDLKTMLGEVRKEYWMMVILVIANIPLLYVLNTDWYRALMFTLPGKIVLAICALVILITAMLMMKYTRPIEYKR